MSKAKHIFKIQLPLSTSLKIPEALIYNEDRSVMGQIPITEDLRSLFPPGVFKIFVTGTIDDEGALNATGTVYQEDELDW